MVQLTQFLRRAVQTRPNAVATQCEGRVRTWREFEARVGLARGRARRPRSPRRRPRRHARAELRPLSRIFLCLRLGRLRLRADQFAARAAGGRVLAQRFRLRRADDRRCVPAHAGCGAPADAGASPYRPRRRRRGAAGMHAYEDLVAKGPKIPDAGKSGDELAGIFYTGGTTGRSKGVMLSHRNLIANALFCGAAFGFDQDVVYLHAGPMFHLADGASTFLVTALGGKHLFMPRFDPGQLLETVERDRVTATLLVPTMINMVVNHPKVGGDRHVFAEVRALRRFADARGDHPPRLRRAAAYRLHPGLWPVRSRALHGLHDAGLSHARRPEGGQAARRRGARRWAAKSASTTRKTTKSRAGRSARSAGAATMSCSATGASRK